MPISFIAAGLAIAELDRRCIGGFGVDFGIITDAYGKLPAQAQNKCAAIAQSVVQKYLAGAEDCEVMQ